ncbi:MAG: peptidase domain-containing ABC transporter [Bacteroidaceae bacterium]|nr:peptidase domain-containing ABC transporter [Bacteroidaceae bacterium]
MKFTRQFDQMDCGPACIRMVASAYGKDYPLSYLRTLSHLTREGVSVAGIRDALKEIGMESATFEMTLDQLAEKCPMPAILHWDQNHFVVVEKVKTHPQPLPYMEGRRRHLSRLSALPLHGGAGRGSSFLIANPAYGRHRHDAESMARHWLNGDKGIVIAIEPTQAFYDREPVKEKHSFWRFAKKYVWPFRAQMGVLAFSMVFGILLSLVTPFITQHLVDDGIGGRDLGIIVNLLLAQLALFVGSFGMGLITSWVSLYMGTRININILGDYLRKLLRLPMTFFETKSIGDYNQRIGDHARLQSFVTQNTLQTAFSLLSSVVLLTIIAWFSLKIFAVYIVLTAASIAWMTYFFRRRKALDYEQFRISAENQNKLYELMSGITDIKLNGYEDYKLQEWSEMQERQYRMSKKVLKLGQIQSTGYMAIGQLRNILITFWIASDVVGGLLTLGMMMSISNIIGQVNGPLGQLIGFLQQFQDAKISLERSEEVHLCEEEDGGVRSEELGVRSERDNGQSSIVNCQSFTISNLTFSYTGSIGKPALEDVTFTIPAGKTTAIVGESGSGKTTLMKLLLKFYAPTKGQIRLGDRDLGDCHAKAVRAATGIVMQDNFIFSDTIKNNIVLGETYDKARLDEAIDLSCLREFIDRLPLGVETKVGRDGTGISGGEKQRLMIARAIYKQPQYLMLDEATSSLDAENERQITENLEHKFHNRTMLVIAHRLSTVKNADNIVVLRKGHVVEQGTHQQLVALHGYYYELVHNQLELAQEG